MNGHLSGMPSSAFDCPYDVACLDLDPDRIVDAVLDMAGRRNQKPVPGEAWIACAS
jgi:hypothetical protein